MRVTDGIDMRIGKRDHEHEASAQDNVRIIERRIDWLDQRIKQAKKDKRPAHFDISERDALIWLLREVKNWIDIPNVEDDLKDF